MDHLLRGLAPMGAKAWDTVNEEAVRCLKLDLAGRRLVAYEASGSWETSAVPLGRATTAKSSGVELAVRSVSALVEVRAPFAMDLAELQAAERGAQDVDTNPVIRAAREAALAENGLVFHGNPELGISGIIDATPHDPIEVPSTDAVPESVSAAMNVLRSAGIAGPYGLALGESQYAAVTGGQERGGYPLLKHLQVLLDGPVVWSPGLQGAVLLSQRGGDYQLYGGQDWSIGYRSHDAAAVTLYLEETVTFRVYTPEAAVALAM